MIPSFFFLQELPKVYSAGLDFAEFYNKPLDTIRDFCETFLENWAVTFGSRLTTIAAINVSPTT